MLNEMILPEFDHEMEITRNMLERVPDAQFGWRPHAKSWTLSELATHLASLPGWAAFTLTTDELDIAPPGGEPMRTVAATSRQELLERFDANTAAARAALSAVSDETMRKPWTLLDGNQVIFTQPRLAVLRFFVLSHVIHHRAQLGMYLRLHDIPLPSVYGPSADDSGM